LEKGAINKQNGSIISKAVQLIGKTVQLFWKWFINLKNGSISHQSTIRE
jgi:hypothetical protein